MTHTLFVIALVLIIVMAILWIVSHRRRGPSPYRHRRY